MTPKDRVTHEWLLKEAAFTAGHIVGFWSNENIANMEKGGQ